MSSRLPTRRFAPVAINLIHWRLMRGEISMLHALCRRGQSREMESYAYLQHRRWRSNSSKFLFEFLLRSAKFQINNWQCGWVCRMWQAISTRISIVRCIYARQGVPESACGFADLLRVASITILGSSKFRRNMHFNRQMCFYWLVRLRRYERCTLVADIAHESDSAAAANAGSYCSHVASTAFRLDAAFNI